MRSIQHHTAVARQHIAGDIVAAIPAFGDEHSDAATTSSTFFGTAMLTLNLATWFGGLVIFEWHVGWIILTQVLILILNRVVIRLLDSSNDSTRDEVVFVVRPDRVDVMSGTAKNPKSVLESHPVESIRLWRPDNAMTGRIAVGESEWFMASWHEKQILRILSPLGVDLSGMPQVAIDALKPPHELHAPRTDGGHS